MCLTFSKVFHIYHFRSCKIFSKDVSEKLQDVSCDCLIFKAELQNKYEEISQTISAAEKAIEMLQSNNDLIKVCQIQKLEVTI